MIVATLGTMYLDFPRLIHALDAYALASGERTVIQLGLATTEPKHCEYFDFRGHDELVALQREARVVVCHAGIGAVTDALACAVPFVVVPRLRAHGEHNNDHQLELARAIERRGWARAVYTIDDLEDALRNPLSPPRSYQPARGPLLHALRACIET